MTRTEKKLVSGRSRRAHFPVDEKRRPLLSTLLDSCACAPGEDPYSRRRDNVLVPLPDYPDLPFAAIAMFYGMERDAAMVVRVMKARIMNLQEYDGKSFISHEAPESGQEVETGPGGSAG